jgi:Tat protein secretion system quality control protein TatD with DNase activity
MWMPQLDNKEILGRLLKSTIGVIGRRTSEAYANIIIGNVLKDLTKKHEFLKYVEIHGALSGEIIDIVDIKADIENIDSKIVGNVAREFIETIARIMGKNAGYYFLREIKQDLPSDYEQSIKEIGIDFDYLQLKFITEIKQNFRFQIENADALNHVMTTLFDILDVELGRDAAFRTLNEFVIRLSTQYEVLRYAKINDVRAIRGIDVVSINKDVNLVDQNKVGAGIQKIIQELNIHLGETERFSLIEKLKSDLNEDYIFKLGEMGVDLDVIQLKQTLVVKHVFKALVDILSEYSTQSYAIIMVNSLLDKFQDEFEYMKHLKIDGIHFSEGLDAVIVPIDIEHVRGSDLGRGIQKIIESLVESLGENAGRYFVEKFRARLGKAYVFRMEEVGVNLHLIELKRNMLW